MDDTVAGALIPNIVNGGTKTNRVLELEAKAASGQHRLVIVDRLASMYFDQTTQGIPYALNADLVALSAAGRCDPGGADVQWWMESIGTYGILNITVYTLNVTYNDGSTGQIVFSPPVTNAPPAMFLIDPGVTGKTIKAIADVTISGTSGTGPANLIATKELGAISMNPTSPANYIERKGWEELGLAEVGPDAHLMAYIVPMSAISTTPVIDGTITIGGA